MKLLITFLNAQELSIVFNHIFDNIYCFLCPVFTVKYLIVNYKFVI